MGTLERTETLAHRIGSNGRITVKTISGTLRVRGIEGEEARLTVTYRIRAADRRLRRRALETGRVIVDRGPGSLEVETPERRLSTGLAWLFGGARVRADVAVEVRGAPKVRYETMSGSIEAMALVGDQKYRTVSGDIRLWNLGGLIEAGSISGSVTLDNAATSDSGQTPCRAASKSVPGVLRHGPVDDKRQHCPGRCARLVGRSPGRVDLGQRLPDAAQWRHGRAPGDLGSITSHVEHRSEGGRGYWRSIVGDGRATFKVNSTSGGLRIFAARPGDEVVAAAAPGHRPPSDAHG